MSEQRPLTERMQASDGAVSLNAYEQAGGYLGLRRALKELTPDEVSEQVKKANLRGRGGAGFPTGIKWASSPAVDEARTPRYLVANADEMEPGTFKDRLLMEGDPHQLIEGMIIGSYAVQADVAYVFLRAAYSSGAHIVHQAIEEAYAAGYLGKNILGSGFDLELYVHTSAGRYICGESSALLNALEGRRAIPRAKPPRPTQVGLWGRPTIVNNVETFCNVPHILRNGADWYLDLGQGPEGKHGKDGGTKIYGASGPVNTPGAWELPIGTTLGEVLYEQAGGLSDGRNLKGVLPGGASTDFLTADHLDTPLDFDSVEAAGSRLGTGNLIVLDDQTCPVGMVQNLEAFFARESCGWCTPCREGLPWTAALLQAMEDGDGRPEDLDQLERHTHLLGPGKTFCMHAPGAMEPLQSALRYFREDFERHINEHRCPWS